MLTSATASTNWPRSSSLSYNSAVGQFCVRSLRASPPCSVRLHASLTRSLPMDVNFTSGGVARDSLIHLFLIKKASEDMRRTQQSYAVWSDGDCCRRAHVRVSAAIEWARSRGMPAIARMRSLSINLLESLHAAFTLAHRISRHMH